MKLQNTVALVTGASSGIGEATAKDLAAQGAAVALVARREDRLEALAKDIENAGGKALVIKADVTDRDQAFGCVERTVSELGSLDIVINNAGMMLLGPAMEAPIEEWEKMIDVNVTGFLYIAKASLPHLTKAAESNERGCADLVNISSVAGRRAAANSATYNFTKFGVAAFSEALRQEVTQKYVRVSVVEPGVVATELQTHNRDEVREQITARFPGLTEPLQSEDIADAINYIVTRPKHIAINEVMVRPTQQQG